MLGVVCGVLVTGLGRMLEDSQRPLRICLLSYRSNPHCGGQGVYLTRLSRSLVELGHHVDIVSGPPYPLINNDIPVFRLPSLDLYNPDDLFRVPSFKEILDPVNFVEWLGVSTMGFPEPYTFGKRAHKFLKSKYQKYDIVHDNQSLSYGLLDIQKRVPTVATIHHPITIDRKLDIQSETAPLKKLKHMRWYSFIGMQKKVSRQFSHIITVSKCSRDDIAEDFGIPSQKFRIVPNGINTSLFRPLPDFKREKNRLIVTNSADMPLKGLRYLLYSIKEVSETRDIHLTVIGRPKEKSPIHSLIRQLDIGKRVTFTGRVSDEMLIQHYAEASIAVVPSLYEGFGLPSGEAMACGLPVISTTGGALPEVVGDAGILVPPKDPGALAGAIIQLLDNPDRAKRLGQAGYNRVHNMFTWEKAAQKTVAVYKEVIRDHSRLQ